MSTSVGFIGTFLYICAYAVKAQTIPDAGLVATDRTWTHEINLPTSDSFCGIWANLTAWWRPDRAPELSGTYKIDLTFEHPNFKETKRTVMEIKIPNDKKETTKYIQICFSHCPTRSSQINQSLFTIHAKTDNIQSKNPIDLQISAEKSYNMECYPTVLEYVYDMNTPTITFGVLVIILLMLVFIVYLCNRYIRGRGPGGGLGGPPPLGGGGPGQRPQGGDPSDGGHYRSVGSNEDPSEDGPPGSGSHAGGPTGVLYYKNEIGRRLRQIFGGGQTVVEQLNVPESVELAGIVTKGSSDRPRGGIRKRGTKKNKPQDE